MMKRWVTGICVAACIAVIAACGGMAKQKQAAQPKALPSAGIIPAPVKCEAGQGAFAFSSRTTICLSQDAGSEAAQALQDGIAQRTGQKLSIKKSATARAGAIVLEISASASNNPEGYKLVVDSKNITVSAPAEAGLFYGVQSILQMADAQGAAKGQALALPAVRIEDQPRFGYRGFMLDESRHFFGKQTVKECLDTMAYLKLNRFHWHLTDAPGWRIEIKKYPKLTEVGSIGNLTDDTAPAAFYTQSDIKEIVEYARQRQITIIPEIDMPGHATAATHAYPELSGGGVGRYVGFTFNPGREQTYEFLADVFKEVAELFPGPYIHLGGDEVSFGNQSWKTDPEILKYTSDHGLKNEIELEHYFVRRMSDTINSLGKTTMGWDEITSSQVPADKSVLFWWRHDKRILLRQALEHDYKVVLCPRAPVYFDFIQAEGQKVGRKPMFNDLARVYKFPDPIFETVVPEGRQSQVMGVQACLWTEMISTRERLNYMTYPRLAALAEDAWTPSANKNLDDFMKRVPTFLRVLDQRGINYYDVFNPSRTPEPAAPVRVRKKAVE